MPNYVHNYIHSDCAGNRFDLIFSKMLTKYIERRRSLNDDDALVLFSCEDSDDDYKCFLDFVELPISDENHPKGDVIFICNITNDNDDEIYLMCFKKLGVQVVHNESKGSVDIFASGSNGNVMILVTMLFDFFQERSNDNNK